MIKIGITKEKVIKTGINTPADKKAIVHAKILPDGQQEYIQTSFDVIEVSGSLDIAADIDRFLALASDTGAGQIDQEYFVEVVRTLRTLKNNSDAEFRRVVIIKGEVYCNGIISRLFKHLDDANFKGYLDFKLAEYHKIVDRYK